MIRAVLALMLSVGTAWAEGERSGEFDYYVLSLSWTPTWCAIEGDGRGSPQCDAGQGYGFTLHGLWPQYETGWPSFCPTTEGNPSRAMTGAMANIMGSSGLAWYQWTKHGVCSGLSASDYFTLSRLAYERVNRPVVLRRLERDLRLPAEVIEEALLEENPQLTDEMTIVTCRDCRVQEMRICLTQDLEPRACGRDVARDCALSDALFSPMR
jgi:ribonuclease T2